MSHFPLLPTSDFSHFWIGVVSAADMTLEAVACKLGYLFGYVLEITFFCDFSLLSPPIVLTVCTTNNALVTIRYD